MSQQHLTEWLSGFVDGDGSIRTMVSKSDSTQNGYRIDPSCVITNRYVAGIFDSDGGVSGVVSQKDNSAVNHYINPRCRVTQSVNTPLESKMKEWASNAGVEFTITHKKVEKENYSDYIVFEVRGKQNVRTFLELIKPHLVVKKRQANIMLSEILPRLSAQKHTSRRGFLETMKWVDRLNSHKGGSRGKYSVEYFEDEWNMTLGE